MTSSSVCAVIDGSGKIINRIVDDGTFVPPAGYTLVLETAASFDLGGTIIKGVYRSPPPILMPAPPTAAPSILPQNMIAQLSPDDLVKVQAAFAAIIAQAIGSTNVAAIISSG